MPEQLASFDGDDWIVVSRNQRTLHLDGSQFGLPSSSIPLELNMGPSIICMSTTVGALLDRPTRTPVGARKVSTDRHSVEVHMRHSAAARVFVAEDGSRKHESHRLAILRSLQDVGARAAKIPPFDAEASAAHQLWMVQPGESLPSLCLIRAKNLGENTEVSRIAGAILSAAMPRCKSVDHLGALLDLLYAGLPSTAGLIATASRRYHRIATPA
jgi:hypothetical protein